MAPSRSQTSDRGERRADREIAPTVEELLDHAGKRGTVALAGGHRDDVAVGVDDHQSRPRAHAVLLPCLQLRVVQHGMGDAMAGDRATNGSVVRLVGELRRVHADHHEALAEPLLERAQLLDDAKAVDAAERPEIEHHHASPKVTKRERVVGVEPPPGTTELRRADPPDCGRHDESIISRRGVRPRTRGVISRPLI